MTLDKLLFLCLTIVLFQNCAAQTYQPTILISIDGLRWDYPEKAETPTFDLLIGEGVRADRLIPCFPTKTFPNHYSIVTGLYPENHGITANSMYDRQRDLYFGMGIPSAVRDPGWWQGEPIWVTAEKQGVKTAILFWPGSEAKIADTYPSYWLAYDGEMTNEQRVQAVLDWIDLPKAERPSFLTLYFSSIDDAGHDFGPDSKELAVEMGKIDAILKLLRDGLQDRDLFDKTNIVIVSDHGMTAISPDRVIYLDDFIDLADVDMVDWNPVASINPLSGKDLEVFEALSAAHPHLNVYRRSEIPEKFRYRNGRNTPAILALADEGWAITSHQTVQPHYISGGTHGYDNALISMGATFIAHGPAFKSGVKTAAFQNIHIYEMLAYILGIKPAPNDGNLDAVRGFLHPGKVGR